jgi:hypothetical protein
VQLEQPALLTLTLTPEMEVLPLLLVLLVLKV